MNSFLVCRCGGVITFKTSGQEYSEAIFKMIDRIRETAEKMAGYCTAGTKGVTKYGDSDKIHESHRLVAEGLGTLVNMLRNPNDDIPEPKGVSIVIQLTSKSYNDEVAQKTWATISVCAFSLQIAELNFVIAMLDIAAALPDLVAVTSDGLTAVDALQTAVKGKPVMAAKVLTANNVLTALLLLNSTISESSEEWVQYICLYAIAGEYAHIYEVELNKDSEYAGYIIPTPELYDINDYYMYNVGRGVRWELRTDEDGNVTEVKPREGINTQENIHMDETKEEAGIDALYDDVN